VILVIVALTFALILMAQQRAQLVDQIREACSETGAAAKLDLSSFVPLCLRVK
jgi:hypothetical protein